LVADIRSADYSMVVAHEGNLYVRAADRAELPVSASVVCRRVAMARWKTPALKFKPKVATQKAAPKPDRKAARWS
jgi:hypothetical protein